MPNVLDARPCLHGIALTMYNETDGSALPPVFLPDSREHSVILHLGVDYTCMLLEEHLCMLMAGIWSQLHFGEILSVNQWQSIIPEVNDRVSNTQKADELGIRGGFLDQKIKSCKLCTSATHEKPKVYGSLYGKDHLHAWLEIVFEGPESPAMDPGADIDWLSSCCNLQASKVCQEDRNLYYVNAKSMEFVQLAGMGILSRCRQLIVERMKPTNAPLQYVCFDAEWVKGKLPHLFAFVWVKGKEKKEFVLMRSDEKLAKELRDREIDIDACFPELSTICKPERAFVRKDSVVICMYSSQMVTVAAVEVLCKLAPVVIGFGNRGGDFHVIDKYVPGVFHQRIPGAVKWWQIDYYINSGNFPVFVDFKDVFGKLRNPVGPDVGAASGLTFDMPPDRNCPYAPDLKCLLCHMLGNKVSDLKRKWDDSLSDADSEPDYCLEDARAVARLTKVDPRPFTIRGLCAMAGVPWNWISMPATLGPPGYEAIAAASIVASMARCNVAPRKFRPNKKYKLPGGINHGIPSNIYPYVAKVDISGAYRAAIQKTDLPDLLEGWTAEQLESMECQLHKVPDRGICADFGNLYVITNTSGEQTPMQYLMDNPDNPKLMVNAIIGCLQSGCMGKDMQLVAYSAMAVVHDGCNRMRHVAIDKLSCCQVCDMIHTPESTCDRYEPPLKPMCVPAITDEVILLHLTPGTEKYVHQVLQTELRLSFLARDLVLKPAEVGTLISWSGSSAFMLPPNATPDQCKGKGPVLNSANDHAAKKRIKRALFYLVATLMMQSRESANFLLGTKELSMAIVDSICVIEDPIADVWPSVSSAFQKIGIGADHIETVHDCLVQTVTEFYTMPDCEEY